MANQPADMTMITITYDSAGGASAIIITAEPGDYDLGLPQQAYQFIQDRGINTSTRLAKKEEGISLTHSFHHLDDQEAGDVWATADGTNNLSIAIAWTGGTITHTLWYYLATASMRESDTGQMVGMTVTAQGWSDGTNSYGLTS